MKKILILFLVIWAASMQARLAGQQVIASTGDFLQAGTIQLSFTVGELAVQTLSANGLILTQGFQQPWDAVLGIDNPANKDLILKIWPNPVADILFLQVDSRLQTDLVVESYDILGRLNRVYKFESPINKNPYSIDMSGMESGIYILKIRTDDHSVAEVIRIRKQ